MDRARTRAAVVVDHPHPPAHLPRRPSPFPRPRRGHDVDPSDGEPAISSTPSGCSGTTSAWWATGEADDHGATATRGVLEVELAAHGPDEPPGHGQSQAHARAVLRVSETLEGLEHDQYAVLTPDPRALVDDPDVHTAGHGTGLDTQAAAPGVGQRVVDQVGHRPLDQHRIGVDPGQPRRDGDRHVDSPRPPGSRPPRPPVRPHRPIRPAPPSTPSADSGCGAGSPPGCSAGRTRHRWSGGGGGSPPDRIPADRRGGLKHRRLDRRQRGPQVVAHRGQQGGPGPRWLWPGIRLRPPRRGAGRFRGPTPAAPRTPIACRGPPP